MSDEEESLRQLYWSMHKDQLDLLRRVIADWERLRDSATDPASRAEYERSLDGSRAALAKIEAGAKQVKRAEQKAKK